MMPSDIIRIHDHITACLAAVHPEVSRYSRALFAVDKRDRPDLFASCVVLEYGDSIYLVTAAHAIHEIERYGSSVHIGGKEVGLVEGTVVRSSSDGSDPFDIAAVRIESAFASSMALEPLSVKKTMVGRSFEKPHMHCMHGYPATKNKTIKAADTARKVFTTYGFTYASTVPRQIDFSKFKKNTADHLCLSYDTGVNSDGKVAKPPKPQGMSGGGLWVVPNSFCGAEVYIAGILIEQHGQLVFATRIERVIELIQKSA
jgi:hypothetical protein